MNNPVHRGEQPLSAYLLKLLAVIVRRSGGELRIPVIDIMDANDGEGLVKYYDQPMRELVLRFAPVATEYYFVKPDKPEGAGKWSEIDSRSIPSSPSSPPHQPQPLHQSIPFSLDDQRIVEMEDQRLKEAALRAVANFPSSPVTEPVNHPTRSSERSLRREMFSK